VNPDPVTDHQKRNSSESQPQQINNLLSDLGQQLQDPQVRNYRYGTIIKSLTSLISGNKACMKIKDDLPKLKITERLAGNANNILQPRFHSTEINKKKETQKFFVTLFSASTGQNDLIFSIELQHDVLCMC
jgi:hypothetical protein